VTIKQFADELGLTKGAVYKAIRSSSFTVDQITGRSGQITEEGRKILQILFPDQEPLSEPLKETQPDDSVLDDLRERLREAERAREKAEESLRIEKEQRSIFEKLYNETKDELRDQRISAEKEREQYRILIRAEQGLRMKAERNLFQRVKVFFLGEKNQPVDSVDTHGEVK
jgi:hypothetical protein